MNLSVSLTALDTSSVTSGGASPGASQQPLPRTTRIPESTIYGVITFYSQFRLQPMGRYVIRLCTGTACHVANASLLLDTIEDELGIEVNDTTEDGVYTLFSVACIGCCSLAPVMMVNDETYGNLKPSTARRILRKIRRQALAGERPPVTTPTPAPAETPAPPAS